MPTYEFTCNGCSHHFEVFTTVSGKSGTVCPKCGSSGLKETFGAFFVGGNVSRPSAGSGGCGGSCSTCSGTCKH